MQIERDNEIYCVCKECNKPTVFNRPLYWMNIFKHWFSSYEDSNETVVIEDYHNELDVELRVAYYKCHDCSKK